MTTTAAVPAQELRERAGKLLLLSRLLAAPPDAEALEDAESAGWIAPGWEAGLEGVQVEFTRLLSAPGPDAVAAHQSVYTDMLSVGGKQWRGYLGGESCAQAQRCYDAARFQPPRPGWALADHVSTQLAFLAHLDLSESRSRAAGEPGEIGVFQELRREFWARFLGRWGEEFGARLAGNRVSEIYRRIGRHLLAALQEAGQETPATR